jgi:hypothetical protein
MLLDRKFDVMRTIVRPRPPCALPLVNPSFQVLRTKALVLKTVFSSIATTKIQFTVGGSYGYEFCPD